MVIFPVTLSGKEVARVDKVEDRDGNDHWDTIEHILVNLVGDEESGPTLLQLDGSVDTSSDDHAGRDEGGEQEDPPFPELALVGCGL